MNENHYVSGFQLMDQYSIRLASKADLPILREIEVRSGDRFIGLGLIDHLLGQSYPQEKLLEFIEKQQVWVICTADEPVGFAAASALGDVGYLEELDVLSEHGRRGLGARLVYEVCQWAKSKGLPAVVLSTFKSVLWNGPFYEHLGFELLPEDQWFKELLQVRAKEKSDGLPVEARVFMRLEL